MSASSAQAIDLARRYGVFAFVLGFTVLAIALAASGYTAWLWPLIVLLPLAALGMWNLLQTGHTLLRNYPLVGHLRWVFEELRPFLRQYIVEDDLGGQPFNHDTRALVYARSKSAVDSQPFGTELDVYGNQYEWINHSIAPRAVSNHHPHVNVGGPQCLQPYSASVLNISAMSFGALGGNAIEALNLGARKGGFYHDSGEGGLSSHHLRHGGDLVWEIGSGYFGCRAADGRFDPARFRDQAVHPAVKMIEIKLSQGAKPGHGGVLPGAKVTAAIAAARGVPQGRDCISPAHHSAFSTPIGLLEFAAGLREASGGKPVGIKLCIGHPWEFIAICKAMQASGIRLDYVVVDGAEGGTGAAPQEFSNHVGTPLREGLIFVRNVLVGMDLRDEVRIAAAGKVANAFSLAANIALGADWCNAARAFMFSLGCVMSQRCHTGHCPTGVATHDPLRQRGLVIVDKAERVAGFHRNTVAALADLAGAAGLSHPHELTPRHLVHRVRATEARSMDQIHDFLEPGVLNAEPVSTPLAHWWSLASPDSFAPQRDPGPGHPAAARA